MTSSITKTKEPLVPPTDCLKEAGPLDGASQESAQIKKPLPSFWRHSTGPRAALFRLLYEKGIVNSEGELTSGGVSKPNYAKKELPQFTSEQISQLKAILAQPFDVTVSGEKRQISLTDLIEKFKGKLEAGFQVTDVLFFGSYLPYFLLFKAPEYFDNLFSDFPPEVVRLIKEIVLSTPSDIDVRIAIDAPEGLNKTQIQEKIRDIFLSPLEKSENICFQKLKTVERGFIKFQLIQFKDNKIELSLSIARPTECLFSSDSYTYSLSSSSPDSYFNSSRQGLIDTLLGIIRVGKPEEIFEGYPRLISRMTKGNLPVQLGLTKVLAERFRYDLSGCVYAVASCATNHHNNDPLDSFVFLWNFSYFSHPDKETIPEVWKSYYLTHEKPKEEWATLVIEMLTKERSPLEKKISFKEIASTLHTAFFLCAATERKKGVSVDLGCMELDRPILMARVGAATMHILYDPAAQEMNWDKEHLRLLQAIFPWNQRYKLREVPLESMGGFPKLGLFSCLFIKDPLKGLLTLVTRARDETFAANFVASLALSIVSNNNFAKAKTSKTISQELVYLVKMAESAQVAARLMDKACARGLIREGSLERTAGRLHLSCSSETLSPQERIERCKKLSDEGEVCSSKYVDELYSSLLMQQTENNCFQQVKGWLSMVPFTEERRKDISANLVRKYLNENKLKEAQSALISFLETSNSDHESKQLLDHFVGTFLRLEEKSWSNFNIVERVLQKASPLCCDISLLARYHVASKELSQTYRWSLSLHNLPLLLQHKGPLPHYFLSYFIPTVVREILLSGNPYSTHKNLLENFVESCVSQLHESGDLEACFSVFDATETGKLQFTWRDEIDRAWQACIGAKLSSLRPDLNRINAVMLLARECPDCHWVLLGRGWIQQNEQEKLQNCIEHISSIESVDFLWEVYKFYSKKGNEKYSITTLDKIFKLNPESIEKIWTEYSSCLRERCDLSTQATLLRSSLVVRRANGSVGPMVLDCGRKLIKSRKQSELSSACDLLLDFSSQLTDVEPEFWLTLLQKLRRHAQDKVWGALMKIDALLAVDGKVRREAWMIGLDCATRKNDSALLHWFQKSTEFPAEDMAFLGQVVDSVLAAAHRKKESFVQVLTRLAKETPLSLSVSTQISVGRAMLGSNSPDFRNQGHQRLMSLFKLSEKRELISLLPSLADRLLSLPSPPTELLMKLCTFSYYQKVRLNNISAIFAVFFPEKSSVDFSAEEIHFLLQFLSTALHGKRFPANKTSTHVLLTAIRRLYATLKIYPELRSDPHIRELINAILGSQHFQNVATQNFLESINRDYLCFLLRDENLNLAERCKTFDFACETCKAAGGVGECTDEIVSLTFDLLLAWVRDESLAYIDTQKKLRTFFIILQGMRDNKKVDRKRARARFSRWASDFVHKSCALPLNTPHFREHMDTVGNCLLKFMQDYSNEPQLLLELLESYTRRTVLAPSTLLMLVVDCALAIKLFHSVPLKKNMIFLFLYHQRCQDALKNDSVPPDVAANYYNTLVTNYLSVEQFQQAFQVLDENEDVLTAYSLKGSDSYYTAPFRAFVEAAKRSERFGGYYNSYAASLWRLTAKNRAGNSAGPSARERLQKQQVFSLFFKGAIFHYFSSKFSVKSDDLHYEVNVENCLSILYQQYNNGWFADNPSALLEMTGQMIPFVTPLNRKDREYLETFDIGRNLTCFIKTLPDKTPNKEALVKQADTIISRWQMKVCNTSYDKKPV